MRDTDLWPIEPITDDEYRQRTEAVRAAADAAGLDAIIAYSTAKITANVRYLTSYYTRFAGHQHTSEHGYYMFGAAAALVPVEGEPLLLTDALWDVVRAQEMSKYSDVSASTRLGGDIGSILARRGIKRVGIDNWFLFPAPDYLALKEAAADVEVVPTFALSEVRAVKSPAELERHRRAEMIADAAAIAGMEAVEPGAIEYQVGLAAEETLRRLGDLETAGGCIISAGVNSATGSSLPTRDKTIQRGEWVLFDVLPKFDGYAGDIARMRLAGDPEDLTDELRHLHATTVMMNAEITKAVRPGVTPAQLNAIALEVARHEGMAEYKIDLVGHGVGLDIHDVPDYYYDERPLGVGEVFTIEPCLLKAGVAGTRIEDVVVVTDGGCEVLTNAPRGLFMDEA